MIRKKKYAPTMLKTTNLRTNDNRVLFEDVPTPLLGQIVKVGVILTRLSLQEMGKGWFTKLQKKKF